MYLLLEQLELVGKCVEYQTEKKLIGQYITMQESLVCFNHFVDLNFRVTKHLIYHLIERCAAACMKKNHEGVDLIIPMLIPSKYKSAASDNGKVVWPIRVGQTDFFIGLISIQIKNGDSFSNHSDAAINMLPGNVFNHKGEEELARVPSFGILMNLRQKLKRKAKAIRFFSHQEITDMESRKKKRREKAQQPQPQPQPQEEALKGEHLRENNNQPLEQEINNQSFDFSVLYRIGIPNLTLDPSVKIDLISNTLLEIAGEPEWPIPKVQQKLARRRLGFTFGKDQVEKRTKTTKLETR